MICFGLQVQDQIAASPVAAASTVSNIQLNAPGKSNLLNAPALAPASGSLPADVVSLAAKQNANTANQATQVQDQLAKAEATPETFIPVRSRPPSTLILAFHTLALQ